jgi:hypothetical protein
MADDKLPFAIPANTSLTAKYLVKLLEPQVFVLAMRHVQVVANEAPTSQFPPHQSIILWCNRQ